MTLLTPEENQGGGDDSSTTAPADSEDELLPSSQGGTDLSPSEESPLLATEGDKGLFLSSSNYYHSGSAEGSKSLIDSQTILSSLERERDKKSPSRFSVDVECESIVSDYSELGGQIRDIERDVHYLDRDTLRSDDVGNSFLATLKEGEADKSNNLEQREGEDQADYEKRLRKINLLSLAQEFAELKKVDAQANVLNFHKKNLNHSVSPGGSRGQSLERPRRSHSKSPNRTFAGNMPGVTTAGSASVSNPGDSSGSNSNPSQKTTTVPKNHEKTLAAKKRMDSLPANEARRDPNQDLPVNMRRNRLEQGASVQGGSDTEGDFDVYNIESALPHVNWATLEKQLELAEKDGQNRLESCKNEREEIRRRLAMSTEDDSTTDDGESSEVLSPRKQRLQARLQGTPSGMQICFMNDDMCDEDDDDNLITARLDDIEETSSPSPCPLSTGEDSSGEATTTETSRITPPPNHPCFPGEVAHFTARQTQLQSEATLALAQASTMARMQLEVEKQTKKKSPIADMVGIPTLGGGRKLRLNHNKLHEMNIAQLQVLVNDLHSQIELLNEDLVHLLIERDDLHMEQDSMLVDIEDLTSHCHDPKTTNNNKSVHNNNRPTGRRDHRK